MRRFVFFFIACWSLMGISSAQSPAVKDHPMQLPDSYAAEMFTTGRRPQAARMRTLIYYQAGKMRSETDMGEGMRSIKIQRSDRKMTYMLSPERKAYIIVPLSEEDLQKLNQKHETSSPWKLMGQETIRECVCDKYETSVSMLGVHVKRVYYINPKTKWPVRVVQGDGVSVTDYLQIVPGTPHAHLFEVPADYKQAALPRAASMAKP